MKRFHSKVRLFGLIAIGALSVLLLVQFSQPLEPRHAGRSATEWLEIARNPPSEADAKIAEDALRTMDDDLVPLLLRKLQAEDNERLVDMIVSWNQFLLRVHRKVFATLSIEIDRDFQLHDQALRGFEILGTNGNSAVPELASLLKDQRFRRDASEALTKIGTSDAFNALADGLKQADAEVRYHCLVALCYSKADIERYIPKIKPLVNDPDERVAALAVESYGEFHPQKYIFYAEKLKDSRPAVRKGAIRGFFGAPDEWLPTIATCFNDPVSTNRILATNIALSINPYRAPEIGVVTNGLKDFVFERYERIKRRKETSAVNDR